MNLKTILLAMFASAGYLLQSANADDDYCHMWSSDSGIYSCLGKYSPSDANSCQNHCGFFGGGCAGSGSDCKCVCQNPFGNGGFGDVSSDSLLRGAGMMLKHGVAKRDAELSSEKTE